MNPSHVSLVLAFVALSAMARAGESPQTRGPVADQVRQIEISVHLRQYERLFETLCQLKIDRSIHAESKEPVIDSSKDPKKWEEAEMRAQQRFYELEQAVQSLRKKLLDYDNPESDPAAQKRDDKAGR